MTYDVIVIGAGHNGLTAAARLAQRGRKVLVLEARDAVGGLAGGEEFHPGYRSQGVLLDTSGVRRSVIDGLGLGRHGLETLSEAPAVYVPRAGSPGLILHREAEKTVGANEGVLSPEDARRYREFRGFIERVRPVLRFLLDHKPPPLPDDGLAGLPHLARAAFKLRLLGRADMLELLRIGPMCVADWLNEWFEHPGLKAALAGPCLEGAFAGPWSAGTAAAFLIKECSAEAGVRGGPSALTRALEAAARTAGVEVLTSAPVRRIRVANGAVVGVALAGGRNFDAPVVAASCDPKRAFLDLLDPVDLPLDVEDQMRVLRARGTTAKVNLALNGPLELEGFPGRQFEAARTGEHLDDLERAFDAVKYRRFSTRPQLEIRVPTVADPALAPAGHHVVEILAHFAPYALEGGWTKEAREALGDAVVAELARYAPSLKGRVVAREVLTPADLEARYGLTGGHVHHGEHALDQLFVLRPGPDCAGYATPVRGLFLCGSGSHPGGGLTCMPGWLAAETILKS